MKKTPLSPYTIWLWPTLFAFVALLRYCLPSVPGETMPIHDAIIQSITDGNKWGLMALVKIPDVPLIPTLALLFFKNLLVLTSLSPVAMLCALSQATLFIMIARALPKTLPLPTFAISILVLLCLPAVPLLGNFLMLDDCNWISAIPLTHALLTLLKNDALFFMRSGNSTSQEDCTKTLKGSNISNHQLNEAKHDGKQPQKDSVIKEVEPTLLGNRAKKEHNNSSDDLPLTAVLAVACDLALLVFCGPIMLCSAILIMAILLKHLHELHAPKGTACILLMPIIYALLLWLPWYSTNDDNIFTETFVAFQKLESHEFVCPVNPCIFISFFLAFIFLMFAHSDIRWNDFKPALSDQVVRIRMISPTLFSWMMILVACLFVSSLSMFLGLSQAGLGPALIVSIGFFILLIIIKLDIIDAFQKWQSVAFWKTPQAIGIVAAAIACLIGIIITGCTFPEVATFERATPQTIVQHAPPPPDIFDYQDAPSRERLADLADSHWSGSRIVIVGKRLVNVVYPDEEQTRFRPMEQFSPEEFVALAKYEQLNLLVPPDDGRFYESDSPLTEIHANGAPYLFLLAKLPGDWQLWCSIPPPNETRE
ncbi:MAG: hypothetical protein J6X55_11625 [Victivallales bacterium]|nr:hypothetical protein [Victivallales bacterium]